MLKALVLFFVVSSAFSVNDASIDCGMNTNVDLESLRHECLEHDAEEACQRLAGLRRQDDNETDSDNVSYIVNTTTTTMERSPDAHSSNGNISNSLAGDEGASSQNSKTTQYQRTTWADFIEFEDKPLSNFYYFTEGLSSEQADRVVELAKRLPSKDGTVFDKSDTTSVVRSYRKSRIRWIPKTEPYMWLYWELANLVKIANKRMWNFDITGMSEDIQFTEYHGDEEGFYDWHLDVGESTAMRKISVVVMLSDPSDYEGGFLQIKTGQMERNVPKEKGTVVIFPPYFLHRVTPVTKGIRRTLVLWVSGPPLR